MPARRDRVADLVLDLRRRHPGQRLLVGIDALCPTGERWPGDGHRDLARVQRRERLAESPVLHAWGLAFILLDHLGERFDARLAVDGRLHGLRVEESAAIAAETLEEEVVRIAGIDQTRAVQLRSVLVGEKLADLAEFLPIVRRR